VTDDGSGGADAAGAGLRGLADRVAALGGQLGLHTARDRGTVVSARLPLTLGDLR
jgi:signal transduction histidine kinase